MNATTRPDNSGLILQGSIAPYRAGVFEILYKEINVHHGDDSKVCSIPGHVFVYVTRIGPFYYFRNLLNHSRDHNFIVLPFDVHCLNIFDFRLYVGKRKTFLWGHGLGRKRIGNLLRKMMARFAAGIIFYSKNGACKFPEIAGTMKLVAPNTIYFKNVESLKIRKSRERCFVFVGRLQRRKKIHIAIDALKLLDAENSYKLIIIGNGECLDDLIKKAEGLDHHKVEFVNGTYDEEVLACYIATSIAYISPGDAGLGVLHAAAYGTPSIVSKYAKNGPEIDTFAEDEITLFDGTPENLAKNLNKLVAEYESGNLEDRFVKARAVYERNQISNMISTFKYAQNMQT